MRNLSMRAHESRHRGNLLPEQRAEDAGKLCVVLDMDETLIHSIFASESDRGQFRQQELRKRLGELTKPEPGDKFAPLEHFEVVLSDGERVKTIKRPGVDAFLARLAGACELIVFTAAVPMYANPVLDRLEGDGPGTLFRHRLFRNACVQKGGFFLKDLSVIGRDLRRTVLVDNNNVCFLPQPENGVPIESFYDDERDEELPKIASLLERLAKEDDVRPTLARDFGLKQRLKQYREHVYGPDAPVSRL